MQRRHLKLNSFSCHSKLHWAVCSDQERIYCCYCSCRKAKQSVFYYLGQRCSLCISCQARWPKMLSSGRDSCTNCAQTCSFSLTVCRLLFPSVFVCFPVCLFVCLPLCQKLNTQSNFYATFVQHLSQRMKNYVANCCSIERTQRHVGVYVRVTVRVSYIFIAAPKALLQLHSMSMWSTFYC